MPKRMWLLLGVVGASVTLLIVGSVYAGDPIGGVGHGIIFPVI